MFCVSMFLLFCGMLDVWVLFVDPWITLLLYALYAYEYMVSPCFGSTKTRTHPVEGKSL
jgi:hypothetical protein